MSHVGAGRLRRVGIDLNVCDENSQPRAGGSTQLPTRPLMGNCRLKLKKERDKPATQEGRRFSRFCEKPRCYQAFV